MDINKMIWENIDIDKENLENIGIDKRFAKNIDINIDKEILQNIKSIRYQMDWNLAYQTGLESRVQLLSK